MYSENLRKPKNFFKRTRKAIKKFLRRSLFQQRCRLLVNNFTKSDLLNMILTWILLKFPALLFFKKLFSGCLWKLKNWWRSTSLLVAFERFSDVFISSPLIAFKRLVDTKLNFLLAVIFAYNWILL